MSMPSTSLSFGPGYGSYAQDLASWGSPMGAMAPNVMPPAVAPAMAPAMPVTPPPVAPVAPGVAGAPAAAGANPWFLKSTFLNGKGGLNLDNIGSLAQGIGALGTLWSGFQANRIARDAMEFQKKSYGTNLSNQIASYNTALEDRVAARQSGTSMTADEAAAYLAKNKLKG